MAFRTTSDATDRLPIHLPYENGFPSPDPDARIYRIRISD